MTLVDVKGLGVRYRSASGTTDAVRGISFKVNEGEFVSLVGGSGSGKSTAALAIARLTDHLPCEVSGTVSFKGRDLLSMGADELRTVRRQGIAYVFQDPSASLNPVMRVGEQIAEVWGAPDPARVSELLASVRIEDTARVARAYPHQLSGGMKQRAVIAMALAKKPSLIVADEPTSALDAVSQRQVLSLFMDMRRTHRVSTLFITHDLNVARVLSDRILVMQEGLIVEEIADPRHLNLNHPYAVKLLRAAEAGRRPKTLFEV